MQIIHVGTLKSSQEILHINQVTTARSHTDTTHINISTFHSTVSLLELAILTEQSSVLTNQKSNVKQEFNNDDLAAKYDGRRRKSRYAIYVVAEFRGL
jgi:hypothetical protein